MSDELVKLLNRFANISITSSRILVVLIDGPAYQCEIAEKSGTCQSNVSRGIRELEEAGWVSHESVRQDRGEGKGRRPYRIYQLNGGIDTFLNSLRVSVALELNQMDKLFRGGD